MNNSSDSPLTEEIRLQIFGSGDLPDFRVDLLSNGDYIYSRETLFDMYGDSREIVFAMHGDSRGNLYGDSRGNLYGDSRGNLLEILAVVIFISINNKNINNNNILSMISSVHGVTLATGRRALLVNLT